MDKGTTLNALQLAFGYKAVPYFGLNVIANVPPESAYAGIATVSEPGANSVGFPKPLSLLGTAFFMPCKLDGIQLPNEPIIEISGSKTIIKTPIDGKEGTFKEHFAMNDYAVTIRGVAVNENNSDDYPELQVRQLRTIFEKRNSVEVVCKLLSMFNIKNLAIVDFNAPPIEGAPGMQPYEFICLSDQLSDLDLDLLEGSI
jgi:hypothetical protein